MVIDGEHSDPVLLEHGVPQGSVFGPKKYTMYSKPLRAIIRRYGLCYHFYADDAQTDSLELIERYLTDIEKWMRVNMLKLNSEKTEVVLFTSKHNYMQIENVTVCVGDTDITSVNSVKNLGVIFDSAKEQHLNSV